MRSSEVPFSSSIVPGQPDRTLSFDISHHLGNRILRRDTHQHMHMIGLQPSLLHPAFPLFGKAPEHWPQFLSQLMIQHFPAVFRNKYDVILALPTRVGETFHIVHDLVLKCALSGSLHTRRGTPGSVKLRESPRLSRGFTLLNYGSQLIVVYCRPEALASDRGKVEQFLDSISQLPIPPAPDALVVSDNADFYGFIADIEARLEQE